VNTRYEKPPPAAAKVTGDIEANEARAARNAVRVELVRQARDNLGLQYREIAARMGISKGRAIQLYRKACEVPRQTNAPPKQVAGVVFRLHKIGLDQHWWKSDDGRIECYRTPGKKTFETNIDNIPLLQRSHTLEAAMRKGVQALAEEKNYIDTGTTFRKLTGTKLHPLKGDK
jgi:transcriptional regulator with XRE-family HTH domain